MNTSLFIMLAGAAIIAVTVQGVEVDPPEDFFPHHEEEPVDEHPLPEEYYVKPVKNPFYRDPFVLAPKNSFNYRFRAGFRVGQCEDLKQKLKNLAYELAYVSGAISGLAEKRETRTYYPTEKRNPYVDLPNKFYKKW